MRLAIHRHDNTTNIYKQLFIPTNGYESTKQLVASVMTNLAFSPQYFIESNGALFVGSFEDIFNF